MMALEGLIGHNSNARQAIGTINDSPLLQRPGLMEIDRLIGWFGMPLRARCVAFDGRRGAPPPPGDKCPG